MSRIIGDRTRNTLDEMEEVARARNRDVAEEGEIRSVEKSKRRGRKKAKPKKKSPSYTCLQSH